MAQPRTIALDAMGGDFGPGVIIPGAAISLVRHPSLSFIFTGKESLIRAELEKHPELAARSRVIHTDTEIAMDDKPSQALRRGKGSSMWLALEAVKGRGRRRCFGRQYRRAHGDGEAGADGRWRASSGRL